MKLHLFPRKQDWFLVCYGPHINITSARKINTMDELVISLHLWYQIRTVTHGVH